MSEPFGVEYAQIYDAIYHDKDYAGECELLERVFRSHAQLPIRRILDLGCGTGRHAELLAGRGYQVIGVDRSPHMVAQALARSEKRCAANAPEYHIADMRSFRLNDRFDAVLMMFAVMSYQLEDDDVLSALRTARTQLRDGGLLLFDCWFGPAVLHQRPEGRTKTTATGDGRVIRTSTSALDEARHRVVVRFHVENSASNGGFQTDETHPMRYFFPSELERFLGAAGFSVVRLGAMPDFDRCPDETTWNVLAVGVADRPPPR